MPIYARVSTNGSNGEIHFNCYVEPDKWNQIAERFNDLGFDGRMFLTELAKYCVKRQGGNNNGAVNLQE